MSSAAGTTNRLDVRALVWVDGWTEPEARRVIPATADAGFDLTGLPASIPLASTPT